MFAIIFLKLKLLFLEGRNSLGLAVIAQGCPTVLLSCLFYYFPFSSTLELVNELPLQVLQKPISFH